MLEPLVWMFRNKDFKKRFLQLCLTLIVALLILIGLLFSTNVIEFTFLNGQILNILFTVVCFFTSLIIQGYFWELTSNIISRNWDISASNVYSGKIKERFFIDLPKFNVIRFLWRGLASIVATIMMMLPFVLVIYTSVLTTPAFNFDVEYIEGLSVVYQVSCGIVLVMLFIALPALLWNYAKQDSVFAVWNFPKAFYLIDSYPLQYIKNLILFVIFYLLNTGIIYLLNYFFMMVMQLSPQENPLVYVMIGIISTFMYLYSLHVYAYLLGTIAPVSEG